MNQTIAEKAGGEAAVVCPVVMTMAGSDSGGGAGIQADLKTITALDAFGVSVITALTAQNGAEVRGIHESPADFVSLQLRTVLDGFPVKAAKTGMLSSVPIIEALSEGLREKNFPLVADPVCVSQSGHPLLRDDALDALREHILPMADLLTPNKPEAELLSGMALKDASGMRPLLDKLHGMGAKAVLLKGGHFESEQEQESITDWLSLPGEAPVPLAHARVSTINNHGTGCTLSAAIAVFLARGLPLLQAVAQAQAYLSRALASSFTPGIGAGPPNFMGGRTC